MPSKRNPLTELRTAFNWKSSVLAKFKMKVERSIDKIKIAKERFHMIRFLNYMGMPKNWKSLLLNSTTIKSAPAKLVIMERLDAKAEAELVDLLYHSKEGQVRIWERQYGAKENDNAPVIMINLAGFAPNKDAIVLKSKGDQALLSKLNVVQEEGVE